MYSLRMNVGMTVRTLLALRVCLALVQGPASAAVRPDDLRCEDLANPVGIDTAHPQLGWKLESRERNQRQTAYRILVSG